MRKNVGHSQHTHGKKGLQNPENRVPQTRQKGSAEVPVGSLMEAICAIHMSSYVDSPVKDRGGLMLVGPPGVLKTSFLDVLEDNYHNAISASNLNTTTLLKMQQQFHSGTMRSLILPDVQAIYAGDPRTAARLEQALMQLAGEGNRGASWQDARHQRFKSRCTIFGAITNKHYEKMAASWEDSGFFRRFLWSAYTLADPDILMDAIEQWKRADIGTIRVPALPVNRSIPESLTDAERREIRTWLKHQPGPHEIQFSLLCRATSALRWHYDNRRIKRNAIETMREFSRTLTKDAALVRI